MICAVVIDWDNAPDFPDGDGAALGRPLAAYPMMAAKSAARTHRRFCVSSAQPVKSAALQYGAIILDPPAQGGAANASDFLKRAAQAAASELIKEGERLELLVALSTQAPAVTGALIDAGVNAVLENQEFDSALSVSRLPGLSSGAALRETAENALELGAGSAQDLGAWFPNWSLLVLKPSLLAASDARPFSWLGKRSFALKQPGIWPVEYQWQIPSIESWLRKNGVHDSAQAPEPQPQAQKSAKRPAPRPIL